MIEAGLIGFQVGEFISAICVVTMLVTGLAATVLLARSIMNRF